MAYRQMMMIIERLKFNQSSPRGITAFLALKPALKENEHEICHAVHVTSTE
jgi:hypothetical protein